MRLTFQVRFFAFNDLPGFDLTTQWYNDIRSYNFESGYGAAGRFDVFLFISLLHQKFGIMLCMTVENFIYRLHKYVRTVEFSVITSSIFMR